MKKLNYIFIFLCISSVFIAKAQSVYITEVPYIEEANTKEAKINKIELTDKYTILYMSFQYGSKNDNGNSRPKKTIEDLLNILLERGINMGGNTTRQYISIRPSSSLIAVNGDRTFKFIKASGIPTEPNQMEILGNEKVNFKVYYQRLDPGITVFDFFEGHNSDQIKCWNYYKVHVTNPSENIAKPIDINSNNKISPVFFINGKVLDIKTKEPVNAKIEFLLSPKMQAIDSTMTFWGTGKYKSTLPNAGIYNCVISAQGYLVSQETIVLDETTANGNFVKDFYLSPITKGDVVRLNNIYFETSQYELLSASYSELNKLVILLKENPKMRIILEGHTDIIGDKQANVLLSENRVNSVKNYLIQNGVSANKIETKGWGSAKPISANGTDEERKFNRRVEFRILDI